MVKVNPAVKPTQDKEAALEQLLSERVADDWMSVSGDVSKQRAVRLGGCGCECPHRLILYRPVPDGACHSTCAWRVRSAGVWFGEGHGG